jgi:hypothetical protein
VSLVEFVLARIADDEASAVSVHDTTCDYFRYGSTDPTFGWECNCGQASSIKAHCNARRIMVDFVRPDPDMPPGDGRYVAVRVLALMALPYKDHPDFQPDWMPPEIA